jgi:hypothetical protein
MNVWSLWGHSNRATHFYVRLRRARTQKKVTCPHLSAPSPAAETHFWLQGVWHALIKKKDSIYVVWCGSTCANPTLNVNEEREGAMQPKHHMCQPYIKWEWGERKSHAVQTDARTSCRIFGPRLREDGRCGYFASSRWSAFFVHADGNGRKISVCVALLEMPWASFMSLQLHEDNVFCVSN